MAYCRALADASDQVELTSFGKSPRGRDLPVLIVDKDGQSTVDSVRETGRAVVLVQGCVHAGESAGKDAGLMLARDLTVGGKLSELLDEVTLLFIPIFNVDGHERFGPHNRINQNGPVEMGWRTTARNLNLNRDFLKADTAEMRAWLGMYGSWLPDFFVDVHSTDGADFQYELTYAVERHGNMDPKLTEFVKRYIDTVSTRMTESGRKVFPYVWFKEWHDPRSGLQTGAAGPRYSQGYTAIQNRPGLLIETHMLKSYQVRVEVTYEMLVETLRYVGAHHESLAARIREADEFAASKELREQGLALRFESTPKSRNVQFLGVEYEAVKSEITGGEWFKYSDVPTTFEVPYYDQVVPKTTVKLPEAYVIPPEWDDVIERLELHGVSVERLTVPVELEVRSYKFEDVKWKAERSWHTLPYEGRYICEFSAKPITEKRTLPAGSAVVDTAQRTARIIAHALEPVGPDSFVHWGFFNPIFQRTEYVESYVIEQMAIEMLADDPRLATELEEKKRTDPAFAASPDAIRLWLYERTPYFDARVNVYPVSLIDDRDVLERFE
jgi:Zinc carboxypeptidase